MLWALANVNPFASFLEIVRAPLLGKVPSIHHYAMALLMTVLLGAAAMGLLARYRQRLYYWL